MGIDGLLRCLKFLEAQFNTFAITKGDDMGRKSKLTADQWHKIRERHIAGETVRALAKEFGVSSSTVQERVSAQADQIKAVANQIVATERAVMALPIAAQITAQTLAAQMRAMSDNLAAAGVMGSGNARLLQAHAQNELAKIADADPMADGGVARLQNVAILTKVANEASEISLNLLKANKEFVDEVNRKDGEKPKLDPTVRAARIAAMLNRGKKQ